ncbi:hypothetical protein ACP4OV_023568 [Aristida adscensionis]
MVVAAALFFEVQRSPRSEAWKQELECSNSGKFARNLSRDQRPGNRNLR